MHKQTLRLRFNGIEKKSLLLTLLKHVNKEWGPIKRDMSSLLNHVNKQWGPIWRDMSSLLTLSAPNAILGFLQTIQIQFVTTCLV